MNPESPKSNEGGNKSYFMFGKEAVPIVGKREVATRQLEDALESAFETMPPEKVDEIYNRVRENNQAGRAVEH